MPCFSLKQFQKEIFGVNFNVLRPHAGLGYAATPLSWMPGRLLSLFDVELIFFYLAVTFAEGDISPVAKTTLADKEFTLGTIGIKSFNVR